LIRSPLQVTVFRRIHSDVGTATTVFLYCYLLLQALCTHCSGLFGAQEIVHSHWITFLKSYSYGKNHRRYLLLDNYIRSYLSEIPGCFPKVVASKVAKDYIWKMVMSKEDVRLGNML
jgi:hypothetical protein